MNLTQVAILRQQRSIQHGLYLGSRQANPEVFPGVGPVGLVETGDALGEDEDVALLQGYRVVVGGGEGSLAVLNVVDDVVLPDVVSPVEVVGRTVILADEQDATLQTLPG